MPDLLTVSASKQTYADMLTVPATIKRAHTEGLPVTEYSIRAWIKSGALPVRRIGRKSLIYWPNLLSFLTCGQGGDIPAQINEAGEYGTIRRLW